MEPARLFQSVGTLLHELVHGAAPDACWLLNPDDPGLLASLDRLSAESASAAAPAGGASIAAHVDHLRYGFELLNRWARGEHPFDRADYTRSWQRGTVTDDEWAARRTALRTEIAQWDHVIGHPREVTDFELTGLLAGVVHLAYHVGAIRQIDRAAQGPPARR
jgi:hypothetical protein